MACLVYPPGLPAVKDHTLSPQYSWKEPSKQRHRCLWHAVIEKGDLAPIDLQANCYEPLQYNHIIVVNPLRGVSEISVVQILHIEYYSDWAPRAASSTDRAKRAGPIGSPWPPMNEGRNGGDHLAHQKLYPEKT